jgi:myo-inositol-1(or 4)-monophosphatase
MVILTDSRRSAKPVESDKSQVKEENKIPKPDHRLPQLNVMEKTVKATQGAFRRHFLDIERMLTKKGGSDLDYVQEAITNITEIAGTELHKTGKPVFISPTDNKNLTENDSCWLLDPVESKRNFACGRMPVGMRMIYMKGEKAGLIMFAMPATNEIFHAEKGLGAKGTTRLRVAGEKDVSQLDVFTFVGDGGKHKLADIISLVEEKGCCPLVSGCFSHSVCEVAGGKADAIIAHNLTAGDVAFADLMLREAGGIIKDISGCPASIESTSIIAGSATAVQSLLP